MHAKPCFYCIVLLTTLFVSSCYWQPFPLESPLSTPWAQNVTTFAEALNSTLSQKVSLPLPPVMRAADRCWCDFSTGAFFEPFNVTRWEHLSVRRLKDQLEDQQRAVQVVVPKSSEEQALVVSPSHNDTTGMPQTPTPTSSVFPSRMTGFPSERFWSLLWPSHLSLKPRVTHVPTATPSSEIPEKSTPAEEHLAVEQSTPSQNAEAQSLPLVRREYDLRPYGFGILIDFGWTR